MMPALQGLEAKPCKIAPEHRSLEAPLTLCWGLTLMLLRGETQEWSTCVHVGSHRSLKGTIVANHQDGATSSSQWRVKALDRRKANSKSHHVWSKTTKPDRPLEVGTALSLQEEKGHNQAVWDPGVPFSVLAVIKWISASGQFAELRFTFCSLLCMHVILHVKKKNTANRKTEKQKTKTLQGGEPQKDRNSVCPLVPAHPAPPDPAEGTGCPGEQKSPRVMGLCDQDYLPCGRPCHLSLLSMSLSKQAFILLCYLHSLSNSLGCIKHTKSERINTSIAHIQELPGSLSFSLPEWPILRALENCRTDHARGRCMWTWLCDKALLVDGAQPTCCGGQTEPRAACGLGLLSAENCFLAVLLLSHTNISNKRHHINTSRNAKKPSDKFTLILNANTQWNMHGWFFSQHN